MTDFDPAVVAAVLAHMNGDHADDNLLIARAFGDRAAVRARMVDVDGHAGHWVYALEEGPEPERPLRVEWSVAITERPEIRREIVILYDRACAALGLVPREHE
ncbi:MAG: DUF2470 domain-containing protein [Microcella sp.]|uniref:DUF2470 domain-containing protein n=1 Tax=Microcella sp. TaxID=1913979 RepID=UPI00331566A6